MARIFITGSSDGLGQLAAESLINQGHHVVLHARNKQRAQDAIKSVPDVEDVLTGNLVSMEETKQLAEDVNALGRFDSVIHNAGINRGSGNEIFTVNTLAPYILTCLIQKPQRLIYLSSGMHKQGDPSLEKLQSAKENVSYSDSKNCMWYYLPKLWPGSGRASMPMPSIPVGSLQRWVDPVLQMTSRKDTKRRYGWR